MNSSEWWPHAISTYRGVDSHGHRGSRNEFVSSVEWVPHLIAHDDLLGPYLCLDAAAFATPLNVQASLPAGRVGAVVGFVTKGAIPYGPDVAQTVATAYIRGMGKEFLGKVKGPWKKRLGDSRFSERRLVVRTQIVDRKGYMKHLRGMRDHFNYPHKLSDADLKRIRRRLPKRMWMTEFSCVELFSANHSKFGEILLPLHLGQGYLRAVEADDGPAPPLFRMINYLSLHGDEEFCLGLRTHTALMKRRASQMEF